MTESSLEEQLARIRRLAEQMTQVAARQAELANEIARDRDASRQSPLHEVRDYRVYRPPDDELRCREDAELPRRATADDTSLRRRRRR
jgi:hypothetical protein